MGSSQMDPTLYKSAQKGNSEDLKKNMNPSNIDRRTPTGNTLLHVFAQFHDSVECVNLVLDMQVPIFFKQSMLTERNLESETALHIASKNGRSKIVQELINYAKKLDKVLHKPVKNKMMRVSDKNGDTALHKAVKNNHVEVVNLLVENDKDFKHPLNEIEETPLYLAVERGYDDIVSSILENCTSPNYNGPGGKTALHAAAFPKCSKAADPGTQVQSVQSCNKREWIPKLLEKNPTLTKQADESGKIPLHYAAYFGDSSLVEILLEKDRSMAYTTASKDDNMTAFHIAACRGYTSIMEKLLEHCPDCWDIVTNKGQNILHLVVKNGKPEALSFILDQEWAINLINQQDKEGNTPLHLYVLKVGASEFFDADRLLKHRQVDVNAFNKQDCTPHDLARKLEKPEQRDRVIKTLPESRVEGMVRERTHRGESRKDYIKAELKKKKQNMLQLVKNMIGSHLLVATLIATVTFAAGFTLPGGYDGNDGPNQGMAVLIRKAAFKIFVVTDTIAVMSSILAVFLHFTASLHEEACKEKQHDPENMVSGLYFSALKFILIAMVSMVIAFVTGLYTVLDDGSMGLAICVCSLGCFAIIAISYRLYQVFGLGVILRFVLNHFFARKFLKYWVPKIVKKCKPKDTTGIGAAPV